MLRNIRKRRFFKRKFPDCKINDDFMFAGPISNLELGRNVEIQHNVFFHLGGFEWCEYKGSISIGKESIISPGVIIYGGGPGGFKTGSNFRCGPGVKIFSSFEDYRNNYRISFGKVVFGESVMLCTNTVVNYGVTIGSNTIVGANSLVLNDLPNNVFAAGNPAKIIKEL